MNDDITGLQLFLDVDGVLLPTRLSGPRHWPSWEFLTADLEIAAHPDDAALTFSRDLMVELRRLRSRGPRIVWATTWIGAPGLLERLEDAIGFRGDEQIPWDPESELAKPSGVLAAHQRDPGPFIWVDDQLSLDWSQRVEENLGDLPRLLLRTKSAAGLTPDEIRQIDEFLDLLGTTG